MKYVKAKEGVYYNPKMGRVVRHEGYSTAIFWSRDMLDYLQRHYPTTLNVELAGCLGVSPRTLIRKARELGLEKDASWLSRIWEERRLMAWMASKRKGYPGRFPKGVRSNPSGEFKPGHRLSDEAEARRSAKLRQWYRIHPHAASDRARKAWETRRRLNPEGVL